VNFAAMAMAPVLAAAATNTPHSGAISAAPAPLVVQRPAEAQVRSTEISVLTYNVRGLPWPIAKGRAKALKKIGAELAAMRREGRQPDVVLIQEGFRGEVADLVKASGYSHWAQGPTRRERASGTAPEDGRGYRRVRYLRSGEGWGKFTSAGLHVLSDAPIVEIRNTPYRFCAGFDCLANKGAMLVRLALPDLPGEVDVINTHLNSKRASKVPLSRSLRAHNLQTEELIAFINDHRNAAAPLLIGGDFNVRNAAARYDHQAAERPYLVVSEFCNDPANACEGQDPEDEQPWLRSQDLQAFMGAGEVSVRPVQVETMFGPDERRRRLSDHDGYLVRYRFSWNEEIAPPAAGPRIMTLDGPAAGQP
jgi:endonuclease/exonuclease/phosphatase family metal-dependent hydrolase